MPAAGKKKSGGGGGKPKSGGAATGTAGLFPQQRLGGSALDLRFPALKAVGAARGSARAGGKAPSPLLPAAGGARSPRPHNQPKALAMLEDGPAATDINQIRVAINYRIQVCASPATALDTLHAAAAGGRSPSSSSAHTLRFYQLSRHMLTHTCF